MLGGLRQAFFIALLSMIVGGIADVASAEDEPSAEDRRAAAEAYDRGSAAYLAEDWVRAAEFFELAHRLAPAAPALIQAVRSHDRAGDTLRAATLALRLAHLYGDDDAARETADAVLEAAWPRFVRVDVRCDECTVELDGTLLEHPSFFVEPSAEHTVAAHFSTGDVSEVVQGEAGERRELAFEAPPPSASGGGDTTGNGSGHGSASSGSGGGLPPFVLVAAAVLTAGAGGLLLWSGLDTLGGVDAYEADPTPARLAEGQDKELRTNILIGVTGGLGLATLVLALFTDFGGGESESQGESATTVSFAPLPGGALGAVGGRF